MLKKRQTKPKKTFSPKVVTPVVPKAEGRQCPWVVTAKTGVEAFRSLYEVARNYAGSGVCHTCECGIVDGELEYSPDPIDPPRQGAALICCSIPRTGVSLDIESNFDFMASSFETHRGACHRTAFARPVDLADATADFQR